MEKGNRNSDEFGHLTTKEETTFYYIFNLFRKFVKLFEKQVNKFRGMY